jgi:hypothetical protein
MQWAWVTRCFCEKSAQKVARTKICKTYLTKLFQRKHGLQIWPIYVIFIKLIKNKNWQTGEKSPRLVTLVVAYCII